MSQATKLLHSARRVVVLTGAGMSRESGVPTFRDALTGLWARYDPMDLATPEAFERNPGLVFRWYLERWERARVAVPHAGHDALTQMAGVFDRFTVVTQNVDGLHQLAGTVGVIELHGSLAAFRCAAHGHPYPLADRRLDALNDVPRCAQCDALIRPGVVWFGEPLPCAAVRAAYAAVAAADVMLVVGTSGVVFPAAELPLVAERQGGSVIEINPDPTPLTPRAAVAWTERAEVALPALVRRLAERGR